MVMAKKDEHAIVWKDDTGTYKMGYSQYLQQKMLKVNTLLLICVLVLIVMLVVGFLYANSLIQRIDALDVISKLATS